MQSVDTELEAYIRKNSSISAQIDSDDLSGNLFDSGVLDSFAFVELIAHIEGKYRIELDPEDMLDPDLATISGLVELISRKQAV